MLSVARPYYLRPPSNSGGRERGGSSSQSAAAYYRAVASSRSHATASRWGAGRPYSCSTCYDERCYDGIRTMCDPQLAY